MTNKKLLYQRETFKVYEAETEEKVIQEFTDEVINSGDGKKKKIKNKGVMTNAISAKLFEYLESYNILTYFNSRLDEREMLVKNIEFLPIDVIISNLAVGTIYNRFDLDKGIELAAPIIEFYIKDDKLKNPLVNETHIVALKIASQEEMHSMSRLINKLNVVLKSFFERRNIKLAELRVKFGRYKNKIMLASEISPDNCLFLNIISNENDENEDAVYKKFDTDQIYIEIHNRILGEN